MKKSTKVLLAFSMIFVFTACASSDNKTVKGTYSVYIEAYDWGCGTSKAILKLDQTLDKVSADVFKVTETKQATDFTDESFPVEEITVDRQVTDAYFCNEKGEKIADASEYVALDLYCSPNDGSPLLFTMGTQLNTYSKPYQLNITLNKDAKVSVADKEVAKLEIEKEMTGKTTAADAFETSDFKSKDGVEYEYAYKTTDSDTLVVWLHGLGEGGTKDTDPYITTLANKVTALIGDEFQGKVNSSVLVPQCPTYWMDQDGKNGNFNNGAVINTGPSYYTESLMELIENYKNECGATKVVLAGCSNGGFMTMRMVIDYPEYFAAAVPICEALPDQYITDEEIAKIKDIPLFFIYSNDDSTVVPSLHEIPTIQRLQQAGATNLKVSTTEHVIDTSGNYKTEEGNPYEYSGHWSWIYFDNNESKDDTTGITVWDWMAEAIK